MQKYVVKIIISFMLISFVVGILYADKKNVYLTLANALSYAYANNPYMKIEHKKIEIIREKYKQIKKPTNPEFEVSASNIKADITDKQADESHTLDGEITLSQPVRLWGKRRLQIEIIQDELKQVEIEYQETWRSIVLEIKEHYIDALLQKKIILLAHDNLNRARRLYDQVNIKYNVGKARNHELVRAKLEIMNARNQVLAAETQLSILKGALNVSMGKDMETEINLTDMIIPENIEQNFNELLTKALSQNTQMLYQKQEVEKQRKKLKLVKRQRLPDVELSFSLEREEEIYNAGAGISLELPLWNHYNGDIAEAKNVKNISEITYEALKKEVALDVFRAFSNVELARKSVENLEYAIKEAEELLRITAIDYEEGEISFLAYLEGLSAYREIKKEYYEKLASYVKKESILEKLVGEAY